MIKKVRDVLIIAGFAILIGLWAYTFLTKSKYGFVKSDELIQRYKATLEVQTLFQSKTDEYESNYYILTQEFDSLKELYNKVNDNQILAQLEKKQMEIETYGNSVSEQLNKYEKELMQGVLNQINAYLIVYGKENGFSMIFGTTLNGNILYGEDCLDITEDVVLYVNSQ